jgi:hypothetical protein
VYGSMASNAIAIAIVGIVDILVPGAPSVHCTGFSKFQPCGS